MSCSSHQHTHLQACSVRIAQHVYKGRKGFHILFPRKSGLGFSPAPPLIPCFEADRRFYLCAHNQQTDSPQNTAHGTGENNLLHVMDRLLGLAGSLCLSYMVRNKKNLTAVREVLTGSEAVRWQDQTAATSSTKERTAGKRFFFTKD